jgi:hypothetical protein
MTALRMGFSSWHSITIPEARIHAVSWPPILLRCATKSGRRRAGNRLSVERASTADGCRLIDISIAGKSTAFVTELLQ